MHDIVHNISYFRKKDFFHDYTRLLEDMFIGMWAFLSFSDTKTKYRKEVRTYFPSKIDMDSKDSKQYYYADGYLKAMRKTHKRGLSLSFFIILVFYVVNIKRIIPNAAFKETNVSEDYLWQFKVNGANQ